MIIYKTTNLINGKIYIGLTTKNNLKYIGSGSTLIKAIKKYGKENFQKEIIEYCKSFKDLCEREIYWIKKLDSRNPKIGYNLTIGGEYTKGWFENHPDQDYIRKIHSNIAIERFKDLNERKKQSKRLKKAYKNSEVRKSAGSPGKSHPGWKGYVYMYNTKGKLISKYICAKEAAKKLRMGEDTLRKNLSGEHIIQKGKYKGYTFKLSKEIL